MQERRDTLNDSTNDIRYTTYCITHVTTLPKPKETKMINVKSTIILFYTISLFTTILATPAREIEMHEIPSDVLIIIGNVTAKMEDNSHKFTGEDAIFTDAWSTSFKDFTTYFMIKNDQTPKTVSFQVWGEKADQMIINLNYGTQDEKRIFPMTLIKKNRKWRFSG